MAHPKRKTSVQRKNKRRNHHSLQHKNLKTCPKTGMAHLPNQAYEHDGTLYYKGDIIREKKQNNKTTSS